MTDRIINITQHRIQAQMTMTIRRDKINNSKKIHHLGVGTQNGYNLHFSLQKLILDEEIS